MRALLLATVVFCMGPGTGGAAEPMRQSPKLVLVLSVDQMRADYLTRFARYFRPAEATRDGKTEVGGFEYLKQRGAWFADARHSHYPLFTGPGHSVLLTGALPYKSGIVGNYWFDATEKNDRRYCVEDLSTNGQIIGSKGVVKKEFGISPVTFQVSTVGDELRMATANRAKVWGLALKDRAAVLMAGHMANGVLWFDEESGDWVSSRYYCTNGQLPGWVREINAGKDGRLVDSYTNKVWTFDGRNREKPWTGPAAFRHEQTSTNYKSFTFTPYANEFVLETARRLIENEELGQDETPDILALNFSSNDYVGHEYGAESAEVVDVTVKLDEQFSEFFNWLEEKRGLANILIVLTSDHGASHYPKQAKEEGHFDAEIGNDKAIEAEINATLREWYGFRPGITNAARLIEYNLHLRPEALSTRKPMAEIEQELANYLTRKTNFGYFLAYTRDQILKGQLPATDIAQRIMRSFHPENSGSIVLVPRSFWIHPDPKYKYRTSHGSPYNYDTAVPLIIAGPRIQAGERLEAVSTLEIAPTLSYLLGILAPSGCEGAILGSAIQARDR